MKTFISILALVVLFGGLWWWGEKNNMWEQTEQPWAEEVERQEFCFAKFQDSADSEFQDKYTMRLLVTGDKAQGTLLLLPAEKDGLIGDFSGSVIFEEGKSEKTANLIWVTEGESMTAKQELTVILNEASAKLGFGEMVLIEDGVYEYKDPAKVDYSFQLDTIACGELDERGAVEKYLWENIAKLSPTAPALGGNWYVVAATLDLEKNTGAVTYEDGHIQEKRNFSYVLSADGTVANMTIE